MSGISVALGVDVKQELKKPEACVLCKRLQCDMTCRDFDAYQAWEKSKTGKRSRVNVHFCE